MVFVAYVCLDQVRPFFDSDDEWRLLSVARIHEIEDLSFRTIWGSAADISRKADQVSTEPDRQLRPNSTLSLAPRGRQFCDHKAAIVLANLIRQLRVVLKLSNEANRQFFKTRSAFIPQGL